MNKIGLIGLGTMGSAMAGKLLQSGYQVIGVDLNKTARQKAAELGVDVKSELKEIEVCDLILLSLPGPQEVTAVIHRILAHVKRGQIIVDLSSVNPDTSMEMEKLASEEGVDYLDAPVLGGPKGVGKWILPVGGAAAALERCRPVLESLATKVVRVGNSGSGSALKLLNNMMLGAINVINAEIMTLSRYVGLSPQVVYDLIAHSEAATVTPFFRVKGKKIIERDFSPTFKLDLLAKDNDLCVQMARKLGIPLIIGNTVDMINKMAQRRGYGAEDTSALIKVYEDLFAEKG